MHLLAQTVLCKASSMLVIHGRHAQAFSHFTCCCAVHTGCLHPDHAGFFDTPAQYLQWYRQHGAVQDAAAPTVAVLLYRKHVITQQIYIEQLIRCMEAKGIRPIPIFINGAVMLMALCVLKHKTQQVLLG